MRGPRPTSLTFTLLHVLLLLWGHVTRQAQAAFQLPPFLQTLSEQTLSQSQAEGTDRLFTLPSAVANVPNIRRFTPRKKHLKLHKLMRRLRKEWDPFWMSAERPKDADREVIKQPLVDQSLLKALDRLNYTITGPDGVAQDIEASVTHVLGAWLMQRSRCHVHYVWDDLGILYWPRWVRRGFCQAGQSPSSSSSSSYSSTPSLSSSCSWPPGMHCVPAESRRIRILRWQCRHNKAFKNWNPRFKERKPRRPQPDAVTSGGRNRREASEVNTNTERAVGAKGVDETNETENWSRKPFKDRRRKLSMRCKWKKIPFPVTDDCFCSC
ncbi:noggin-1-like [Littorina saxatilis]|uniref:Uncharacterized protein n=1 Tax=Littorina saxatilis TaxID=31220 RepID=A0AAN9GN14_9CAEN